MKATFKKNERLCHVKEIEGLFQRDSAQHLSFLVYPLKVVLNKEHASPNKLPQILISVPKRRFKRAVDRNLLKRRIKEAYRLSKESLPNKPPKSIAFIYVANEILEFEVIQKSMMKSLTRL